MNKEVLVLDDDPDWLNMTKENLSGLGFIAIQCQTLEEAKREIDKRIKNNDLPYAYLADALARDQKTGQIIDYFVAKTLFEYIKSKGVVPKNFFIYTNHISFEDEQLACELGVRIIRKIDPLEKFCIFARQP